MIQSFGDDDTRRVINGESPRRYPPEIIRPAYRKLIALANAADIADMAVPPSNRLEKLKGRHAAYWSIRVSPQWRIIFQWSAGVAADVTLIDYHSGKDKL
jgi:proteic killer suppression protein